MRKLFYILTCVCLLAACGERHRDYSRWERLPDHGWAYDDTVRLEVLNPSLDDNDTLLSGRTLLLGLRHTYAYPFSNLWLEVTYQADSLHYVRDTVNVTLADIYGRWLGKGFGVSYQTEIPLSTSAAIDLSVPVAVRHIMRVDTLMGITDIGVEVR